MFTRNPTVGGEIKGLLSSRKSDNLANLGMFRGHSSSWLLNNHNLLSEVWKKSGKPR
jgi:hypothetical protein